MAGINILIQIFTSFMSCLIIKSFLDALFIRRTIKNKTIFLWIFYFLLSLYCENNNNITLPKLFLSAAGVLVICLIAYDGKLHKKIAMVFLYHFIWIAIEMLLGYTIMSIVKGNDYANFELLCSIICKIIMLALVKIIPLVIDPSIECDMPSKYCFMLTVLPVISTVVVYNIFLITNRIDRLELIAFSTVSSTLILALNLLVYDIYKAIGTNRNKKRKCNIRKTNFLISGANICKRNCHVK